MGLFDNVRCEYPLPDGKPAVPFQTKTFDAPYSETYVITAEGRLLQEPPWYAEDKADRKPEDTNFHGVLNFYDYNTKTEEWREFNAIFTHGQLEFIQDVSAGRAVFGERVDAEPEKQS